MPRKCGHLLELSMAVLKLRTPARRQGQSRSYPWRVVQRIALRAAQRIIQRLSIWCINHCTANHAARSATSSAASIVCALAETADVTNKPNPVKCTQNCVAGRPQTRLSPAKSPTTFSSHFPRPVSSDLNPHPGSLHPSLTNSSRPKPIPSEASFRRSTLASHRGPPQPRPEQTSHEARGQVEHFTLWAWPTPRFPCYCTVRAEVSSASLLNCSENVAVYNFLGEPRLNYALVETESEKEAGSVASWVDRERLFRWPISARVVRRMIATHLGSYHPQHDCQQEAHREHLFGWPISARVVCSMIASKGPIIQNRAREEASQCYHTGRRICHASIPLGTRQSDVRNMIVGMANVDLWHHWSIEFNEKSSSQECPSIANTSMSSSNKSALANLLRIQKGSEFGGGRGAKTSGPSHVHVYSCVAASINACAATNPPLTYFLDARHNSSRSTPRLKDVNGAVLLILPAYCVGPKAASPSSSNRTRLPQWRTSRKCRPSRWFARKPVAQGTVKPTAPGYAVKPVVKPEGKENTTSFLQKVDNHHTGLE
ncbi:uncharacterized protein BKA78DRAFT_296016 [Phyllosticta capitalensis]|uniref:uncharacterized protein n=1 Tax=Phyllosticta capitalensis TaxID=121624 RepID=UPI00312D3F9D